MIQILLFSTLVLFSTIQNVQSKVSTFNRNEDLIVETNVGLVRGVRDDDGNYTMFMGIPFAKVNESNIFGPAIPHPPFEGIFEANDDSAICPQIEEFNYTTVGTLDCLHLHISVPDSASPDNPLPVMVYIYGGGFVRGFAGRFLYGPKFLVRHDVIFISFNHRLGPYGFMCLDTPEVPGNQGFKDQVAALRWIKNNIGAFGGDVNRITLFGNSAGAMAVGLHLISDTETLFNKGIMQSGNAFYPGVVTEPNLSSALTLAESLGFSTNDSNEAIAFLSTVDVHRVVEAAPPFGYYSACLEKSFPGVERFLSEYAINSNLSKAADVELLVGYNSNEVLSVAAEDSVFSTQLAGAFDLDEATLTRLNNIVRRFYLGDEEINESVHTELSVFASDFGFFYSTIRSIPLFLNAGAEKVYQYLFEYDGNRNYIKLVYNVTDPGARHSDEIGYLFDMTIMPEDPTPEDQLMIDRMTALWTNFAKYGDPTPETNSLLPVKWEPVTQGSPSHYYILDSSLDTGRKFQHRRMAFWDLVYRAYRTNEIGYLARN